MLSDHQFDDTWKQGNPYEQFIGRWSRQVAPLFLSWLSPSPGLTWLDVGCGTGALCAAVVGSASPALVAGIEPSRGFLNAARRNLAGQVLLAQASAAAIPIDLAAVDVVVSGLVLNFIPEPLAALREMARITRRGGTIAAYVWDYAEKMEILRLFWDAAVDLDPNAARLDEGARFPLCRPDALADLFVNAGLAQMEVTAIDLAAHFESFDDYWQPFLGGQGPAPTYTAGLDSRARDRLRGRLEERLPRQIDGSIRLNARAWAVRGMKAD